MRSNLEIVADVLAQTSQNSLRWLSKEIVDLNPGGIAILYDLYWGRQNDGKIACLACEYDFGLRLDFLNKDSFLAVGESQEAISSIIKNGTLESWGHASSYEGIELAENERLPMFPYRDDVEARKIDKEMFSRNNALQEELGRLRELVVAAL